MKALTARHIALLLPAALLLHQLEEYFLQFPQWFTELLNVEFNNTDFLLINIPGLILLTAISLSYFIHKSMLPLVALGTLIFFNGLIHLAISLITLSYSPGAISSLILFLPLGSIVFKKLLAQLSGNDRYIAVLSGLFLLVVAFILAINI